MEADTQDSEFDPNAQRKPKRRTRAFFLRVLLYYALTLVVVCTALGAIGFHAKGWDGAWNGMTLGLLLGLIALPLLGLLISVQYWSGFAGRWGEYQYKKELEGDPNDRSKRPERW